MQFIQVCNNRTNVGTQCISDCQYKILELMFARITKTSTENLLHCEKNVQEKK